jgi:sugar-phosphatase
MNVQRPDIDAVLFDMDGTLVSSHAAVERAWLAWAAAYGVDADEVLAHAHGSPAERTIRRMLPELGHAEIRLAAARQLELQYTDLSDVVACAGAHALIGVLAREEVPWAVVTSADRVLAKARLGAAGILPAVLVAVDDVVRGKPYPDGYLRAAELLQVAPQRTLVVEDSEVGLAAGRAAGAVTAALNGLEGDLRIRDLAELVAVFGTSVMDASGHDIRKEG